MDASKLIPAGSVRTVASFTVKEKGDVAKIKEDLLKMFTETHKEGVIQGEPYLEEGETEETATKVHIVGLWKSKEDLAAHFEQPYMKELTGKFKEMGITFEAKKLKPLLQ